LLAKTCLKSTFQDGWLAGWLDKLTIKPAQLKMDLAQTLAELGKNVKIISEMIASDSTLRSAAQDNPVLCF